MNPQTILDHWFSPETQPWWFAKSDAFDADIRARFADIWRQAAAGELSHWRETTRGRLAEIIVLDQYSRNLHRGSPLAFAQDGMALILAQEIQRQSDFAALSPTERQFSLLPLMHSESAAIHAAAVDTFLRYTEPHVVEFERKHKAIIDRFGRYPHRNAILGRASSAEEAAFLQEPDSSF